MTSNELVRDSGWACSAGERHCGPFGSNASVVHGHLDGSSVFVGGGVGQAMGGRGRGASVPGEGRGQKAGAWGRCPPSAGLRGSTRRHAHPSASRPPARGPGPSVSVVR
jgi:hypothetical protein